MSDLKPCPFCGSCNVAIFATGGAFYLSRRVVCGECGQEGLTAIDDSHAIAVWNTRTPDPLAPLAQAVVDAAEALVQDTTGDLRGYCWIKVGVDEYYDLQNAVLKLKEAQG